MPSYWFPKPKTQARVTDQDAIVAEMAANPNFEKVANDLIGHEAIRYNA